MSIPHEDSDAWAAFMAAAAMLGAALARFDNARAAYLAVDCGDCELCQAMRERLAPVEHQEAE